MRLISGNEMVFFIKVVKVLPFTSQTKSLQFSKVLLKFEWHLHPCFLPATALRTTCSHHHIPDWTPFSGHLVDFSTSVL